MRLTDVLLRTLRRTYFGYRHLCWRINRKLRKSVTVSTKQGVFTVLLGAEESIGRTLYCRRSYELEWISKSMEFLRSIGQCPPKGEGTLVDSGANNGIICIGMLYTGEVEKAIAIEPEPHNFLLLQRNVRQNSLEHKVICLPYAASHRRRKIKLELSESNFGDHRIRESADTRNALDLFRESGRRTVTIESERLDNLLMNLPEDFTENVGVVWVDVQGHEGHVFMGAGSVIAKGVPVVSEIWPYGIRRAGMSQEQFCDIATGFWSSYWTLREGEFVRHPIETLTTLFDKLGYGRSHENVIFTQT